MNAEVPTPGIDDALGLCPLFVSVPRVATVALKVLIESYEGIGVARTQDATYAPGRVLVVLLLVPDFLDVARAAIASFSERLDLEFVDASEALLDSLRAELLPGLATSS